MIKANGKLFSHALRTHPVARGAARFHWIFRLCNLADDGAVRFASGSRHVLANYESLIELPDAKTAKGYPLCF